MKTVIFAVLMLVVGSSVFASDVNPFNMDYYQDLDGNKHYTETPMTPSFKKSTPAKSKKHKKVAEREASASPDKTDLYKYVRPDGTIFYTDDPTRDNPTASGFKRVQNDEPAKSGKKRKTVNMEAKRFQRFLNSKNVALPIKGYKAWCRADEDTQDWIVCSFNLPNGDGTTEQKEIGPMRYVHRIQGFVVGVSRVLAQNSEYSFQVQGQINHIPAQLCLYTLMVDDLTCPVY